MTATITVFTDKTALTRTFFALHYSRTMAHYTLMTVN
jgi:hypothetical protein